MTTDKILINETGDVSECSLSAARQAPASRTQALWQAGLTIEKQFINT
jgi:hypothetical protein